MLPHCQCAELDSCLHKPESLGGTGCWSCPLAERPFQTAVQDALQNTLSTLPILCSCSTPAFRATNFLPIVFHMAPIQPNGFKLHVLRVMQINSGSLCKYPTLQPTCSDASAWCIKRVSVFRVCKYGISCKRTKLFLHYVASFRVSQ